MQSGEICSCMFLYVSVKERSGMEFVKSERYI